jgi:hypothetical protein
MLTAKKNVRADGLMNAMGVEEFRRLCSKIPNHNKMIGGILTTPQDA